MLLRALFLLALPVVLPSSDRPGAASHSKTVTDGRVRGAGGGRRSSRCRTTCATFMSNVGIVVEDEPPAGLPLLGLYQGVPLTVRTSSYAACRRTRSRSTAGPLERLYAGDELVRQVRRVVLHEIAHHFGISDERLRRARPLLTELGVLGGDEPEHERLRKAARVAAVRDPARIHARDPHAVGGAGTRVDLDAAVRVRDRGVDADAQAADRGAAPSPGRTGASRRPRAARAPPGRARTRLGRPAGRRSPATRSFSDHETSPGKNSSPRSFTRHGRSGRRAGRRRRILLLGHGARHRPAVELAARSLRRPALQRERDAVPLRPRIRADEQAALLREPDRVAAGRHDHRPVRGGGLAVPDVAGRADERVGQRSPGRIAGRS